ncbi:MAG: hypothetical protein ACM3NQ_04035 [Bacteroidales bacterium]
MKRLKVLGIATAALCAAVLLFVVAVLPPRAARLDPAPQPASPRPTIVGAFHVHSVLSDGTGTREEVAAAARRAGLSFVIFTDHGNGTREPQAPAYRSGVLCVDGVEISTDAGHYAAIGMRQSPYPLGGEARDVIEDVRRLDGFGVAAHPDSPKPSLRWREWAAPFDAIEWLNADSAWRDERGPGLAMVLLSYPFRGPEALASMLARPEDTLARWDSVTRQRRVVGLAGADAHARMGWRGGGDPYQQGAALRAPSYETAFRAFALRLQIDRPLVGRAGADAVTLRAALAGGHLYSAIDGLAGPADFDFTAQSGVHSARMGDELQLGGAVELRARVNAPAATLALLEGGRIVARGASPLVYRAAERPAVFRVEAALPSAPGHPPIPWIVSNPIYVGGLVHPRVERPRAPLARTVAIAGPWAVEHAATSSGVAAQDGSGGVSLQYVLAPGPRASQFAALATGVLGLAQYDRLQLRARADRPMRVSVQWRVPGAGNDERWQRSVYVSQEPRDITIFLDDLRPIGATSAPRPDLDKVRSLLFVVDTVNSAPGASGWFKLESVALGSAERKE